MYWFQIFPLWEGWKHKDSEILCIDEKEIFLFRYCRVVHTPTGVHNKLCGGMSELLDTIKYVKKSKKVEMSIFIQLPFSPI